LPHGCEPPPQFVCWVLVLPQHDCYAECLRERPIWSRPAASTRWLADEIVQQKNFAKFSSGQNE
jgi:hypothetical protein